MTGLNSSFPQANNVLFIAFTNVKELILALDAEFRVGVFGNSSAFCPDNLYTSIKYT